MTIDQFAPPISFFFYTHGDFFEEIAKYRAGRRRLNHRARALGCESPTRPPCSRFGCVGGASLYAADRTTWSGWPTPHGIPCSAACSRCSPPPGTTLRPARRVGHALRTQQILALQKPGSRASPTAGRIVLRRGAHRCSEERIVGSRADLPGEPRRHGALHRKDGYLQGLIADEAYKIHLAEENPVNGLWWGSTSSSPTSRHRTSPPTGTRRRGPRGPQLGGWPGEVRTRLRRRRA